MSPKNIELLAQKLERVQCLSNLKDCHTLADFQQLRERYVALCENDKQS